jgi:hypothetical protein
MKCSCAVTGRALGRPKPAGVPSADRSQYTVGEGLS